MESQWSLPQQVLDPSQAREQFQQIRTQKENIVSQQLRALERLEHQTQKWEAFGKLFCM